MTANRSISFFIILFWLAAAVVVPAVTVYFEHTAPDAGVVSVAGEFNDWNSESHPLAKQDDGTWYGEFDIPDGEYGYKFVVDGNWIMDPANPQTKLVGENENSLLVTSERLASDRVVEPVIDLSEPRTWTAKSGAQITARFIEIADGNVILEKEDGKKIRIKPELLSDNDQILLPREQEETVAPRATPSKPGNFKTGAIEKVALTKRMFEKPRDYFKGRGRRNMLDYYRHRNRLEAEYIPNSCDPDEPLEYDGKEEGAFVYVPESYDGSPEWGLLIHVDPGDGSTIPEDWKAVMEKHKLIYACAWGAENGKSDMRRVGLALDTLATVSQLYPVNRKRVILSGLSGGGQIASQIGLLYSEYFIGVISHAAQIYLFEHFPYLSMEEGKSLMKAKLRWVMITGDKDKNWKDVLRVSQMWEFLRADYRVFDVPGMGHEVANGEWMDRILTWIEGGKVTGGEPRYDEAGIKFKKKIGR
ncbi:MAG: hypothetical protein KJ626_07505 [Verrucomicrobia bacterium]|nr:hypothetical protein [Verrucomicrobiota bacterium]